MGLFHSGKLVRVQPSGATLTGFAYDRATDLIVYRYVVNYDYDYD